MTGQAMNGWTARWSAMLFRAAICIMLLTGIVQGAVGTATAQSQFPPSLMADFRSAAQLAQQDTARLAYMSATVRDPVLTQQMQAEQRRQSAATFNYIVNAAIAQYPHAAPSIVSTAVAHAPDLRNEIIGSAVASFPGFSNQILSANPMAAAPAYAQAPAYTPAPIAAPQAPLQPAAQFSRPAANPPRLMTEAPAQAPRDYSPPPPSRDPSPAFWDPWEPVNRPLFAVHQFLDDFLIRPVAASYGWITPAPIKEGVRNAFDNLRSPVIFLNDVLQFDMSGAGTTLGRFLMNSTVGGLGFFDVAERIGHPGHPADFAQTLDHYGLPAGPYLVVPVIGPGSIRHHFGRIVDVASNPLTWIDAVDEPVKIGLTVGDAITLRETLVEPLDELRKDSLDWYATFRATYYQDRAVALRKGNTIPSATNNDLFDSFE